LQVTNFHYAIRDCHFDATNLEKLYKNSMVHLQQCLTLETPKTLERHTHEFLHDLHHEQSTNEQTYVPKMSKFATNGGLWGDFTLVYWISRYLEHPTHVWNGKQWTNNGKNSSFEQIDEDISYKYIFSNLRKLNHEQKIIVNILYKKKTTHQKLYKFFSWEV
jgi:hypothetical protein